MSHVHGKNKLWLTYISIVMSGNSYDPCLFHCVLGRPCHICYSSDYGNEKPLRDLEREPSFHNLQNTYLHNILYHVYVLYNAL